MQYLCVEFAKGDDPQRREPRVPFNVEGVVGDLDESPAPQNLIGCTPIDSCEGKLLVARFYSIYYEETLFFTIPHLLISNRCKVDR